MKIKMSIKYNGATYPVDMIDYVNKRIAFRYLDENMQLQGAHVDWNKYEVVLEPIE